MFNQLLQESAVLKAKDTPESRVKYQEISNRINALLQHRASVQVKTMSLGMQEYRMTEARWIQTFAGSFDIVYDSGIHEPQAIHEILRREYLSRK